MTFISLLSDYETNILRSIDTYVVGGESPLVSRTTWTAGLIGGRGIPGESRPYMSIGDAPGVKECECASIRYAGWMLVGLGGGFAEPHLVSS